MNPRINQLVQTLLQKESLEQCSLPELQQFADRNPYFGAAQLLLAKKLQTENAAGFDEQLQKTLLYFHNPLWVEQWLNDTGQGTVIKSKKESVPATVPDSPVQLVPPETVEEAVIPVSTATAVTDPVETMIPATPEVAEPMPPNREESPVAVALAPVDQEEIAAAPLPPRTEPVEPVLENPAFKAILETPSSGDLLFEPYHTVDYFASQGIQFREEEKPQDKFGQQLKSFTEWLKTLKKVPAKATSLQNEPATEEKVVKLAESSIQDREIYTEAMAEVWEKQGNRSKAIDIYTKLSLLEPAKSTYFAAKIEELKKQN